MTSPIATRPGRRAPDAVATGEASPLTAFVPRLAVELASAGVPAHHSVEGSMLSADISGFTALSEKLAGKGKAGAEEITDLVNRCFTALIDAAYEFGGEVLKFGGDALLVLFRGDNHERRAVDGGLAMQAALRASSAAKRANLSMTVGIADGPFDVFLAGSGYRELLVTGPRASEVIRLEGAAEKGDTLVSPSLADLVPRAMIVRPESDGFVVAGATGDEPTGPDGREPSGDLSAFVPPAVREQLAAFAGLGGEHRLVTVGFLMVGGVDALLNERGSDGVAAAFHQLVDSVAAVCAGFGVTLLHTDIAPDGVKFILCAGAPVNPGDTSDAMLQAALQIAALDSPFVLRQGVQTGRVFAGFLGSAHRRTYTLMGDPVNTAARMLGKAEDRDVVAVEAVVKGTRTVFVSDPLEPFLVKGKTEPITAHKVRRASDTVRRDTSGTRLFGRERELDLLTQAIGELGEVVVLSGPAGVGKSRLLDAAWDQAEGLRIFQGACTPYGAASPYSVFRPLLRVGSGIPIDADPVTVGGRLTELVIALAPGLGSMLPLLAVPFGAEVPPTSEADAIDPQFRRARIHDVVVDFLDAVLDGPVFLVVEDLHWADDASGELVNHLVRASVGRPWSGVLTRRPQGAWQPPADVPSVRTVEVEPLTSDDIRTLAIDVSDQPLSDAQLDTVIERSGGNPLFAIELVRAIGRGGEVELPDSVEDLIATRIDDLPPEQRRLIRVASVFGQEFDLAAVDAVSTDFARLGRELDDMVEHRRGSRYRFRHAMYRDAAYGGLPFDQRRRLHARVAEHLLAMTPDTEGSAALLSTHFAAARMHTEAFRYASVAARAAAAAHANREAAELYERALAASRYARGADATARADLLVQLGRSLEFAGELERADVAYERAYRALSEVDGKVDCLRRRARVRQKQNRLSSAVRLLNRASHLADAARSSRSIEQRRAEIHLSLAGIRMDQGRLAESRDQAMAALARATVAEDSHLQVNAYGAIAGASTDWDSVAKYVELGLGSTAPPDAYEARSILAINLGMAAYFAGRWTTAVELYEVGRQAAEAMGNVTAGALAAMNAAEILSDQGRYELAAEALLNVRRVLAAAGYRAALVYGDLLYGTVLMRTDAVADGEELLRECAAEFHAGSMTLYALEAELRVAECQIRRGDDAAVSALNTTLEAASSVARQAVVRARALRLLGTWALLRGDRADASRYLSEADAVCRAEHLSYELALVLLVSDGLTGVGASSSEAEAILDELGVVEEGRARSTSLWLPGSAA